MLPNTDVKGAVLIAQRIRYSIENLRLNYQGEEVQFTISLGIANILPTPGTNCIDLIASADQALYLAKEEGRNRVVTLDGHGKSQSIKTVKPPQSLPQNTEQPKTAMQMAARQAGAAAQQAV